jgi:hypothetical protein
MRESHPDCYAIRRVNPFLGVWQVIKLPAGRAISSDGIIWDIQILAERRTAWGSLNQAAKTHSYYRYGFWAETQGLKTNPVPPGLDRQHLIAASEELIHHIREHSGSLPFPLMDTRELWLLDQEKQLPLVLMASVERDQSSTFSEPGNWSASLSGYGLPGLGRFHAAAELEAIVRKRAGYNSLKLWVKRQPDGSATTQDGKEHILPASMFPPYLIRQDWDDEAAANLVEQYISWIAPALLTLQQLSKHQRHYLERRLQTSAASVDHHWQLYPEMTDENLINTARVQAHIQSASIAREH